MTDNRIKQIADCNGISIILNKLTEGSRYKVRPLVYYDIKIIESEDPR